MQISRRLVLALVVLLASASLVAQSAPDHEARMQVALRLARVLNPPDTYRDRMKTIYASMTPMFAQAAAAGALPPDFAERMTKVMDEVMPYEVFTRIFAEQYAAHFTVDELAEITQFYTSPTGAKMLAASTEIGAEFMKRMSTDLLPKMQEAMRRQGLIK
jgi:hypothetical protein